MTNSIHQAQARRLPIGLILTALLIIAAIMVAATPAEACRMNYVDIFDQADQARTVAIGTVASGGLDVARTLKGRSRDTITIDVWQDDGQPRTSCVPTYAQGTSVVVFLDANDRFIAHYQSALRFSARAENRQAITNALTHWLAADEDSQRLELLLGHAWGSDERLAREATRYLVDAVEHFHLIDDEYRSRLREALSSEERRDSDLGWFLMRLGDSQAAEILESQLGTSPSDTRSSVGLDFFENRHEDEIESRDDLARVIEEGPGLIDRVAALDRCERELRLSIYSFHRYRTGVSERFWSTLAEACRQGEVL